MDGHRNLEHVVAQRPININQAGNGVVILPGNNEVMGNNEQLRQDAGAFIQQQSLDEAFDTNVLLKTGNELQNQQDRQALEEKVRKSKEQNKLIGFALKNADSMAIDISQKAKLRSIKARNLSNIVLNSPEAQEDGPLMQEVKNTINEVEKALTKSIRSGLDLEIIKAERIKVRVATELMDVHLKYQAAVAACTKYLQSKQGNMSPGQAERFLLVKKKCENLVDECNKLYLAREFVHRGYIGQDDMTVKQLIYEGRKYLEEHPEYTEENIETALKKHPRVRTMSTANEASTLKLSEHKDRKELAFLYNLFSQEKLPNEMLNDFGQKTEDKEKAKAWIRSMYKLLSSMPENKPVCRSIVADDLLVIIFQREDGSLEFTVEYKVRDEKKTSRVQLQANARTLAANLAINIVENMDQFDQELTDGIMENVKESSEHPKMADRAIDDDLAMAYLRKALSLSNIDMSNMLADDKIKLAKKLLAGQETRNGARKYIKYYEYGGIEEYEQKKRKMEEEKTKLLSQKAGFDEVAESHFYKNMRDMINSRKKKVKIPANAIEYEENLTRFSERVVEDRNKKIQKNNDDCDRAISSCRITKERKQKRYESQKERQYKIYTDKINTALDSYGHMEDLCNLNLENNENNRKESIKNIEEKYKKLPQTEKYKKEKEYFLKKVEKDFREEDAQIRKDFDEWAVNQKKNLDEYRDKLEAEWTKTEAEIAGLDDTITGLLRKRDEDTTKVVNETNAALEGIDRELGFYESWKEYYQLRHANKETVILDFWQWKYRMEHEKENWEKDREADLKKKEEYEEIIQKYVELNDEIKVLKKKGISNLTSERINGQDTLDLIMHRNKVEKAGKLRDMVSFAQEYGQADPAQKAKAVENGTEWTREEAELKDLLAEFIYAQNTWEMDMNNGAGKRLFTVLKGHADLVAIMVGSPEVFKEMTEGIAKKLPLDLMGIKEEEFIDNLTKVGDSMRAVVAAEVKVMQDEAKERIARAKAVKDSKRKEKAVELAKAKKGENSVGEPTKEEIDLEYEKLKAGKAFSFGGILGSFFGISEKSKEEEAFDNALKEIEDSAKGIEEPMDKVIILSSPEGYVPMAISHIFACEEDDPKAIKVMSKLEKAEKDMYHSMEKQLMALGRTMKKYVDKKFGGDNAKLEKIEEVADYREKGISKEVRIEREEKGQEQLDRMIRNAVMSKDGQGQYLRNILKSYIPNSSIVDLRSMLASAIRNAKPVKKSGKGKDLDVLSSYVGGMFKGAGPLMQKILQGIPDHMIPNGLEDAFDDMKANLDSIPKEIVEAQMLSIIEKSGGTIRKIEVTKSLGAASIGQAFLCKVYGSDREPKEVVIKLLRPDVRNRMLREEKIFRQCAIDAGEGMLRTFDGQMAHYKEELDLTIEAKNCELGKIYDKTDKVKSMKVSRMAPPSPNVLMLDRAPGDTIVGVLKNSKALRDEQMGGFYSYDENGKVITEGNQPKLTVFPGADVQPKIVSLSKHLSVLLKQKKMLDKMSEQWVKEAVFGTGFYHGDLHAGNIMLSDDKLTIIDFGNAIKLTTVQQEKILLMTMAAAAGDPEGFYDGFKDLLSESSRPLLEQKTPELKAIFAEVMRLGTFTSSAERIGAALVRAQQLGFELPGAIYNFQQCQMRVQNTISDFSKEINAVQDCLNKLKESKNEAAIDLQQKYIETHYDNFESGRAMKMALLPDDEQGILEFIRSDNEAERTKIKDFLQEIYGDMNKTLAIEDDKLANFMYEMKGQEVIIYEENFSLFMKREEWIELVKDGYIDIFNEKPKDRPNYQMVEQIALEKKIQKEKIGENEAKALREEFEKKWEKRHEQWTEKMKNFKQKFAAFSKIMSNLDALYKAQDEKKPENEIKELEIAVVTGIFETKKIYKENMLNEGTRRIKRTYTTEAEQTQKINEYKEKLEGGTYWKKLKLSIKDEEKRSKVSDELKNYYNDPVFGDRIKQSYEAVLKAIDDKKEEAVVDGLIETLIKDLTTPVLRRFGNNKTNEAPSDVKTNNKPKEFVDIMSDVVNDEWKKALKNLSIPKILKYGKDIQGDIERKDLSYAKVIWNLMRD